MRILFDSRQTQYKTPFGTLRTGECCVLQIRIPTEVGASGVRLMLEDSEHAVCAELPFSFASRGEDGYELWRLEFTRQETGLHFYWFRIDKRDGGSFRLFRQGRDTNMEAGEKWQLSVIPADFRVPDFAPGAVMYQIFPDRFARSGSSDLTGKLQPFWVHESPDELPEYRPDAQGEVRNNDFFGGNFAGIREKLPYLQELGVGVLYLNPIFMAWSNHRYDTADYRRPDPMLGTEEDFRTLCDAAHARGMRVILDGVFSHTGSNSVYFDAKHVFGHGAASDPNSPYRRWYRFHHYPDDYEAWWGIRTLPCVEELDETYLHYIIEDEDSVIAHWLRLGADGFRLDVVDELPDEFVRRLRRRMRQIDPQSLLLGEVWEDASNKRAYGVSRRYFVDGELDSVMNYPWRNAIVAFLTDADDGTALGESLMTLAENYPPEVLSCVMNHLGTHDTPRILTVLGEPFRGTKDERAHRRMTPVQRKTALMRLRMAAFLQFTLPGMPCIYYGDEAGMEGFEDPFCRVCYPWGHEDEELRAYYRMMSALRGSSEALRRGGLRVLAAGNGRIAFSRAFGDESLIVCVNHSIGEWVLPAGRVRFAESAAPSPTGEVVLMRGGFCLLEPSDSEAHISIE